MKLDDDAVLWSTPEGERAGRPLIVLLHGYGSHEGDLFALAPGLPLDAVVAAPRAPLRAGPGFAWWHIEELDNPPPGEVPADAMPTGVRKQDSVVDATTYTFLDWLDGAAKDASTVSLVGFSQGGALSLQALRAAPGRFAAVVCLSGFVPPGDHVGDAELAQIRPPVFWGRGTADQVIPPYAVERTAAWLPGHADADIRVYEGLAHAVSTEELTDFTAFLTRHR